MVPVEPPSGRLTALAAAVASANLADGALLAILPLAALRAGAGPFGVALVSTAALLPWLITSLPAGVVVDRMPDARPLVAAAGIRCVLASLAAALAAGHALSVPALLPIALGLGVLETFQDTATQSLSPWLVRDAELERANGRLATVQTVGNQLVGPALGGLLATVSPAGALVACAWFYLLAAVALARLPALGRARARATSLGQAVGEGIRFLWDDPGLRAAAAMVAMLNLASAASLAVLPVRAVRPGALGLSRTEFGVLLAAAGVGGVAGAWLAHRVLARLPVALVLGSTVVVLAAAAAAPGLTTSAPLVGVLLFLAGLGAPLWAVTVISFRQRRTPRHLLGRVNAAFQLVGAGAAPCGALVGGASASLVGLSTTFLLAGAVAALALAGVPLLARQLGS